MNSPHKIKLRCLYFYSMPTLLQDAITDNLNDNKDFDQQGALCAHEAREMSLCLKQLNGKLQGFMRLHLLITDD